MPLDTLLQLSMFLQVTCAAIAAWFGALASTPMDVAKSRMMNTSHGQSRYKGTWDCVVMIAREEGLRSLWKGTLGNFYRMLIWQATFYPTYEFTCTHLLGRPGI